MPAAEVMCLTKYGYSYFVRLPLTFRLLLISTVLMILFGIIVHLIEPKNFPTIFDGIWWATMTASTVGFGDFVPKTMPGRILAIVIILIGASFLTFYFSHLSAAAVNMQNELFEGKRAFKGMNHTIIIGWNERSKKIIDSLLKKPHPKNIILIDESLEKLPTEEQAHTHFIKGRTTSDDILHKANISQAQCVIITADPNKDELQSDMHTILTLLAVKGLNPSVKCIVEILTSEQSLNAKRAGADEIIHTNMLVSTAMLDQIN